MAEFQPASLSVLRVGAALRSPIFDPNDLLTKLLGAGIVITDEFLMRLRERAVRTVVMNVSDLAQLSAFTPQGTSTKDPLHHDYVASLLETNTSRELDGAVEKGQPLVAPPEKAFLDQVHQPPSESYDPDATEEMAEQNERRVTYLDELFRDLVRSKSSTELEPFDAICRDTLTTAAGDFDQFVCLGANPFSSNYPQRHSLHVACLAIAIGAKLRVGEQGLLDLARGCLIHDIGMLKVPGEPHKLRRRLSQREVEKLADHPLFSLELTESGELPFCSRVVAYQIHERCDGSGYPRGRIGNQTHELSKIAAIADAFVALAAKRAHREGIQPYHVMAKLLQDVKKGLFDPNAMRGLLQAVSMYPIGSYAQTSDGRVGRVIRSNGDAYTRPILELWKPEQLTGHPAVVNLLEDPDFKIVRPLTQLRAA